MGKVDLCEAFLEFITEGNLEESRRARVISVHVLTVGDVGARALPAGQLCCRSRCRQVLPVFALLGRL